MPLQGLASIAKELQDRRVPKRDWPRTLGRIALARALSQVTPVLAVDRDGIRLLVDTSDKVVGPWTFALGPFASQVMDRALKELEDRGYAGITGGVVLEVGANIGTETVAFVLRHGARSVIAVEAAPGNVGMLRLNVAGNRLEDRIRVLPLAMSNTDGVVTFELSPTNHGDHRVRVGGAVEGTAGEASRFVVDVPSRTLDGLVADGVVSDDLAFAWIDVQGHEGHVLAGGRVLRSIPVVAEFWPYGLKRADGMGMFLAAVEGREVVDLGSGRQLSTGDLTGWPDGFASFTDLLLLPA